MDLDVTVLGFSGPGLPCAQQLLCGDAPRLFLSFSCASKQCLERTELCHEVRNPGPQKPPNHQQWKPPLGTAREFAFGRTKFPDKNWTKIWIFGIYVLRMMVAWMTGSIRATQGMLLRFLAKSSPVLVFTGAAPRSVSTSSRVKKWVSQSLGTSSHALQRWGSGSDLLSWLSGRSTLGDFYRYALKGTCLQSLARISSGEGEWNIPGGLFKWLRKGPPKSPLLGHSHDISQISHFGAL